MNRRTVWLRIAEAATVVLLIALHGWMAFSSSQGKSATFDEIAHLGGGYLQATTGDFRFNAESGTLPQRWAAWPLTTIGLGVPPANHPARRGANVWLLGRELLYGQGRDAEQLLRTSRSMILILSMALAALVYAWSRASHGTAGALLSLALYALSPTILAHARWVTADLAVAFFFLLATGAIHRLLQRVTPTRLIIAALAISGLLLSKMSGLLILPIAAILIVLRLVNGRPLVLSWSSTRQEIVPRQRQALLIGALVFVVALLAVVAVWAAYDWRYTAQPDASGDSDFLHAFDPLLERAGLIGGFLSVARDGRLLPEAYLWGLTYTFDTTRERDAFLRGETRRSGWWWFFPYAVAIKTPLALFGLLGLAVAAWRMLPKVTHQAPSNLTAPLWALLAIYSLAAVSSHLNIGHRHMLPIYPALFILAGTAGRWLSAPQKGPRAATLALVFLCLGSFAWESLRIRPHYLSYFNQLAGGPEHGYRHLVDSSLDWGQDLPSLAAYLERLRRDDDSPVYVAYFGAAPPAYYRIDAEWLQSFFPVTDPGRPPRPLKGGVYCVSATLLQSMHIELPSWNVGHEEAFQQRRRQVERAMADEDIGDRRSVYQSFHQLRSARLFAFLRQREPDDRIGYSIHVYRLSDADIELALSGPLDFEAK